MYGKCPLKHGGEASAQQANQMASDVISAMSTDNIYMTIINTEILSVLGIRGDEETMGGIMQTLCK